MLQCAHTAHFWREADGGSQNVPGNHTIIGSSFEPLPSRTRDSKIEPRKFQLARPAARSALFHAAENGSEVQVGAAKPHRRHLLRHLPQHSVLRVLSSPGFPPVWIPRFPAGTQTSL